MLLKQASTLPVREHNLYTFLERGDLRQLISGLQPTLEGQCVWVLQATRLSDGLVREMVKRTWPSRIVLVSHTKTWGLDSVIYHNIDYFARDVAIQIGATREQSEACGSD